MVLKLYQMLASVEHARSHWPYFLRISQHCVSLDLAPFDDNKLPPISSLDLQYNLTKCCPETYT